jgi:hypothetical protein
MTASTLEGPLRRTFAQWYCLAAGAALAVAGVLGFIADGSFDTGSAIQGDSFLGLEVNGWHNLVHLGSGVVLLAAANTRPTAKTVAFGFGVVYGFVTLWGLIDGDEVFNLIPVNPADNVLHLILSAAAILCAYVSPTTKGQQRSRRRARARTKQARHDDAERREFIAESERPPAGPPSGPRAGR